MAEAIGVQKLTLWRLEDGSRQPDRMILERLAGETGVPLWFMDGVLLPVIRCSRALASRAADPLAGSASDTLEELLTRASSAEAIAMAEFVDDIDRQDADSDQAWEPNPDLLR